MPFANNQRITRRRSSAGPTPPKRPIGNNSESKVAPGNLCLATSRKVLGNDSDAASLKAGLFFLCSCSSSIDLNNFSY